MALKEPQVQLPELQTVDGVSESGFEGGSDPEELDRLEMEVKEMAQKILHYRATLPDQLKDTLVSVLAAQRPVLPHGSDPCPSGDPKPGTLFLTLRFAYFLTQKMTSFLVVLENSLSALFGQVISNNGALLAEEDQETAKKIQLLKAKIAHNVSVMPFVLKRMKECISKIDQLDSQNNRIIHPAFKGKRLADKDVALN
ncbi:hypothetical protein FEM48_Zijuj07G0156700 [Ziziphus jujuba var. spinosa]|uniref:Uncharacterized protein n=1 Tax=Ziziphus jujuba var. spinosa TaxID=714518 RepID=A0A978V5H6_ZIZJJ|nr:hypothetical protein FEM48_Zijuj07G0156700 [Ziziphus jujuba var. spinosa]